MGGDTPQHRSAGLMCWGPPSALAEKGGIQSDSGWEEGFRLGRGWALPFAGGPAGSSQAGGVLLPPFGIQSLKKPMLTRAPADMVR